MVALTGRASGRDPETTEQGVRYAHQPARRSPGPWARHPRPAPPPSQARPSRQQLPARLKVFAAPVRAIPGVNGCGLSWKHDRSSRQRCALRQAQGGVSASPAVEASAPHSALVLSSVEGRAARTSRGSTLGTPGTSQNASKVRGQAGSPRAGVRCALQPAGWSTRLRHPKKGSPRRGRTGAISWAKSRRQDQEARETGARAHS